MKTSKSSLSLSSSVSSDTTKKISYDSMTIDRKKTKKPGVIAQLTRRTTKTAQPATKTTQPATKETIIEPVQKKKVLPTEKKEPHSYKIATLPRMFKTKSSSRSPLPRNSITTQQEPVRQELHLSLGGRNTLTKHSSVDQPSPPMKRQPNAASRTVSLSFNELKKQHQYSLKEVEDMRANMMQMNQSHMTEMEDMRDELFQKDRAIATLKTEVTTKEIEMMEKDKVTSNLEAQCLKLELEKDRLLMVIECAQRDALTGEKIIPDIASWQTMMDKAYSQSEQFLHNIESMNTKLLEIETQCKEQTLDITTGIDTFQKHEYFFV